jgi:RNA-dependent RNA polymerase
MNDTLGRICNAHLALADINGPNHPKCLELARLASMAVDFTKTGVKVEPTSFSPPPSFPDFMGKVLTCLPHFSVPFY